MLPAKFLCSSDGFYDIIYLILFICSETQEANLLRQFQATRRVCASPTENLLRHKTKWHLSTLDIWFGPSSGAGTLFTADWSAHFCTEQKCRISILIILNCGSVWRRGTRTERSFHVVIPPHSGSFESENKRSHLRELNITDGLISSALLKPLLL